MTIPARNLSLISHFGDDHHGDALGTLYVALFAGDPLGIGVEPDATGSYARVAITNDSTLWGSISSSDISVTNQVEVKWPSLTALWSEDTLTHWAVFDNSTGGDLWYSGELSEPLVVTGAGDTPRFPPGSWTVIQQ